jgi:hypothetical protein
MSLGLALLASLTAGGATAGEPDRVSELTSSAPSSRPAGTEPVYPADFYAPFQPQTALDMLERTPGFILAEASNLRGFGGAAGNVLIDGQRPTVKTGGVGEVLRRISAARVDRIILLRGSDAAEAQGQTLVANVILRTDAAGSGNASLTFAHTRDGRIAPAARISHARRIAGWQSSLELSADWAREPIDARYRFSDAQDRLTGTWREKVTATIPQLGLAASTSGLLGGGTLTVNLRLNRESYNAGRAVAIFDGPEAGVPDANRGIAFHDRTQTGELGIDWTRGIGSGWNAKLVSLARAEHFTSNEDLAEPGYRGVSDLRQKPLELVGRATLTREGDHAVRPELGMEIAYNRLISHLDYAEDAGGGLIPVALANADTRVAELRGEAFANLTVKLANRLDLEAGMAFEMSRIRVTGESASEQNLSYWKPSAAVIWSPSDETQVRVGLRRTVDQLEFDNFAASVNQADGRPMGGNARLRPARVTRMLARLDHRWGKGGALALEAYHQWHSGQLGYLILQSGDEALGTIGNARQWGVTMQATLPLDALLAGARLTLDGTLAGSRLRDPVTDRPRVMDDVPRRKLTADFRHDVPRLKSSWGLTYAVAVRGEVFFTAERLSWRDDAIWGAYVETTALAGFKTTLKATAINGLEFHRRRLFFNPDRAGAYLGQERREQRLGATFSLTLAKAF